MNGIHITNILFNYFYFGLLIMCFILASATVPRHGLGLYTRHRRLWAHHDLHDRLGAAAPVQGARSAHQGPEGVFVDLGRFLYELTLC
jgi:hypothetical protein